MFGKCLATALFALLLPHLAIAQSTQSEVARGNVTKTLPALELAEAANNPIANIFQVTLQNKFIPSTYEIDGYANELSIETIIPIAVHQFPDQIIRITFPVMVSTPTGSHGLGDLEILELAVLPGSGHWGEWGLGPAFVAPTASSKQMGQGKWQAGGTAAVVVGNIPNIQIGLLAYNLTSFAGDASQPNVNTLFLQPILNYFFPHGWYIGWGGFTFDFNWVNGGAATLPLSLTVGKTFAMNSVGFDISLEPFFTPIHDGSTPKWGMQLNLSFLLPSVLSRP